MCPFCVYGLRPETPTGHLSRKKIERLVTLFAGSLRVSGCGLFFASVTASVVLSFDKFGN